ncbi:two-partner secretion domain-containing protein [Cupriavidus campinensis]
MSKSKSSKTHRRAGRASSTATGQTSQLVRLRPLCAAIVGIMPALAGADIVPDQSAAQRPGMNQTANGTPMVNIVDPNQRGISHNKFQNFNVGPNGVVFNNSMQNGVSAIGGHAMKNSGLSSEARAIIGEVTGSGKSSLNGTMEIFGRKADLLIANPNGIQVNGATTVNANSLTLSTGKVLGQPDGSVRLGVNGGAISIDGAGISTEGLTHFDIISRTAQLNGEIQGTADIKVVAGQTEYDPETRTHVAKPGAQAVQPIAIDGSQLGSMYGGRIELVATDKGAGVRHQGIILGERDITVTADGDIVLGATQSKQGNIGISGSNVSVTGTPTTGAIGLTSQGDIAIRALHTAGINANVVSQNGTIVIDAATLIQHAADILALRGDAATVTVPSIRINVGDYRLEGALYAVGQSGAQIEGAVIQLENGSYVVRDGAGNVIPDANLASSARLAATTGNIDVTAQNLTNDGGMAMASNGALEFDIAQVLLNKGMITAGGNIAMNAAQANNAGSISGNDISVRADSLANSGQVTALGNLNATSATLDNSGRLGAGGDATLNVSESIDNSGTVLADGKLSIDGIKTLVNRDGGWLQAHTVQLRNIETMTNRGNAVLVAQQGLSLDGIGTLTNDGSVIQAETIRFENSGTLSNANQARMVASGDLSIQGATSLANDGSMIQGTNVTVSNIGTIANTNRATLLGEESLTIEGADRLDNSNATMAAEAALVIRDVKTVRNDAGAIQTSGRLTLDRVERLTNRDAASMLAEGSIAMTNVDTISNVDSSIQTNGDLTIANASAVENTTTEAAQDGRKAVMGAGGDMRLNALDIQNQGGVLQAGNKIAVHANQITNEAGAQLMSGGDLQIEADSLHNRAHSVIRGESAVSIKVDELENTNASTTEGEYATQIGSGGAMAIEADTVNNASGALLISGGDMSISASRLSNTEAATIAAQDAKLTLNAADQVLNDKGGIVAFDMDLATKRLENHGVIEASRNAGVVVDSMSNREGSIAAGDILDFRTKQDLVFDDNSGTYFAGGLLKMHTDGNVVVNDEFENLGTIDLHAEGDITNNSAIVSGKSVALSADNIRNGENRLIWGMEHVSLDARDGTIVNERNGNILSQGTMSLVGREIHNRAGTIRSERSMAIDAHRLENLSAYTDSDIEFGPGATEYAYREVRRGIASTYEFKLYMTLPTFTASIKLDKAAEISAGGDLSIDQRGFFASDKDGEAEDRVRPEGNDLVHNYGGIIASGGNMLIKGDVVNESKSSSVDLMDYLNKPLAKSITLSNWWSPTLNFPTLADFFNTIFLSYKTPSPLDISGLLPANFDFFKFAEKWSNSAEPTRAWAGHFNAGQPIYMLKQMDGATLNMVMSKIFGPTWKAASNDDLRARWIEVSGNDYADLKEQKFYFLPAEKASMSAGGHFAHSGGAFSNGIGGVQQENKTISVKVGNETVDAAVPPYDVSVNLKKFEELAMGISTLPALADLLAVTGMFQVSKAWNDSKAGNALPDGKTKIVPMYETQMRFIDQSKFFGGEYFFEQVGYNPNVPASIIVDNYFINELIRRQLNDAIGTFFAVRDGVQGADMTRMLMDNAGKLQERRPDVSKKDGDTGDDSVGNHATGFGIQSTEEDKRLQTMSTLEVGKPLTQDQMAALDTDIIWFVTESVNGTDVLVPRVYLAPTTQAEIRSGEASGSAVVSAGGNVLVDATKATNASGSIVAGKDVFIQAEGDIVNISAGMSGGIKAGGDVALVSTKGNVVNNGAHIKGGGDVTLHADQGSVDITASVGYDKNGKHRIHEFDDAIVAGGSVGIHGDDVTMNSAYIAANNNVGISADKGSVKSNEMHQMDSNYDYSYVGGGTNYVQSSHTDATAIGIGSSIQAGNSLGISGKKDIVLEGGQYSGAAGHMKAGETLDIKTTTNHAYSRDALTVSQFGAKAGVNAIGYKAEASSGAMEGTDTFAGRSHRDNPNDAGQSNSTGGKKAGRAPVADTVNASFGYSKTTDVTTKQDKTHTNANLRFGDGGLALEGKTVDYGGADIKTPGSLAMIADDIKTTKYEDKHDVKNKHSELFVGYKAEGHSSIADAVNKYGELGTKAAQDGNSTDAGMTALQVGGDVSNLIFNDLAGGSATWGVNHSKTSSSSSNTSENINHIDAGNMVMQAKNDISLNGVDVKVKDKAILDAGGEIGMAAAKSSSSSSSSTDAFNIGVSMGTSASVAGAGVGVSVDVSGSHERSGDSSARYADSTLEAGSISIKSGGDTSLAGANVKGGDVELNVSGKLNIESLQDEYDSNTTKGHWGFSAGAAFANGVIIPTGSVQAGGGGEYRDEHTAGTQSGIVATNSLNANVKGDVNITGGHIIAESGKGAIDVGGKINAKSLTDTIDQDGSYGGGGGGISKSGLGTLNAYGETIDEIHKEDRQNATIAGMTINSGGINGDLNTDTSKTTESIRDETTSGNQISYTLGIADIKTMAGKSNGTTDGGTKWYDEPILGADGRTPVTPTAQLLPYAPPPPKPPRLPNADTPPAKPLPDTPPPPKPPRLPEADTPPVKSRPDTPPQPKPPKLPDTPDNAVPKPAPDSTLPNTTPAPDSTDGNNGRPKKWAEVTIPTPFIGSAGSSQALPGNASLIKVNTNTGKDTGAIGDKGSQLKGPVAPLAPVASLPAQGGISPLSPANGAKAPAANPAPVKHDDAPMPPTPVLSPGSSTAKPWFNPPTGININTGKDTGAIGDKGGGLNVPVVPSVPEHGVRVQGDRPTTDYSGNAGDMSEQQLADRMSLSFGPMLRQGSYA